jgi:AcrR family transcriptional regulator
MNEAVTLTPERILEVTEDVLRRFGLAKATVVDVARALDVSHGSVYRHFPSKASLREAVAKRWLDRVSAPLKAVTAEQGPAPARLERWLRTLCTAKQKKVCDDPEMFQTYLTLAREACATVKAKVLSREPLRSLMRRHLPAQFTTPPSATITRRMPRSGKTRR